MNVRSRLRWVAPVLLAASLGVASCSSRRAPAPLSPPSPPPLASAAPARRSASPGKDMVFEVPKVANVAIDGRTDDWQNEGLSLDVLAALPLDHRDPPNFDARAKLGWDDRGLLVSCEVVDREPLEAEPPWLGDSAEFFLGDAVGGNNVVQFVVAPGVAPGFPNLRQAYDERRVEGKRKPAAEREAAFARAPTEDGYTVEALIRWELLLTQVRAGSELGFQLYVNDHRTGHDVRRLLFFPAHGTHDDPKRMYRIRLVEHPSPPATLAAALAVEGWRVRVSLATSAPPTDVRLVEDGQELARPAFEKRGRIWVAEHDTIAEGDRFGPVQILSDETVAAQLEVADLAYRRKQALSAVTVVAHPAVFASTSFPPITFAEPAKARAQLGPTVINATFYDAEHRAVASAEKPGRYGAVVEIIGPTGKSFRKRLTLFRLPKAVDWDDIRIEPEMRVLADLGITEELWKLERRSLGAWFRKAALTGSLHAEEAAKVLARLFEKSAAKPGGDAAHKKGDTSRNDAWATDERWWHEQKRRENDLEPYRYSSWLPEAAQTDPAKRWPTILFLHGSGERGNDLSVLSTWGPLAAAQRVGPRFPFIVIAPQCPENEIWSAPALEDLLAEVQKKYPVDPDRIYVTGVSMGGFAAWGLAAAHPDWFAAVAPVCGGGDPDEAASLANLPIWAFHGAKDETVLPERSIEMVRVLRERRGRVRFTLYPDIAHDAWTPTYEDDRLYAWFLEQKRGRPKQARAKERGSHPDVLPLRESTKK